MPSGGGGKAQRRDGAVIRLNGREEKRRGGALFVISRQECVRCLERLSTCLLSE